MSIVVAVPPIIAVRPGFRGFVEEVNDATDSDGFGPIEYAVTSDSPNKIQYLLDHGARWQKRFDTDYHPMNFATERGLTRNIRKLKQLGLQSTRTLSFAKDEATAALLAWEAVPAHEH